MAELIPVPFSQLLTRIDLERRRHGAIFELPESRWYRGHDGVDLSVDFHGRRAATALGPAAGPQDQMAQNVVLAWLGGSRIQELKTIQVLDTLEIGRPCIDARSIGFNIEWSQELRLGQSLREYVAASMIIDILIAEDVLGVGAQRSRELGTTLYDLSVGYDLAGISTPAVSHVIRALKDATPLIDELRGELPEAFAQYRDYPFRTEIVGSMTLSTFHGCPRDEIEKICHYLLTEMGLHTIVKLNPTQLGRERLDPLLHDVLGFADLTVNPKAYETGLTLEEAIGIVERLEPVARSRGLGIGAKFSNTLEVLNPEHFLPGEVHYMSGQPLHPIAVSLMALWRERVGSRFPVSFAAGIDRLNFGDALSCGLVPVTTCTDLLRPRGYGRQLDYLDEAARRMKAAGCAQVGDWILIAQGRGEQAVREEVAGSREQEPQAPGQLWSALEQALTTMLRSGSIDVAPTVAAVAAAQGAPAGLLDSFPQRLRERAGVLNSLAYRDRVLDDPRYKAAANLVRPKRIDSHLHLFDCVSCDKCVPVCPNAANFIYELPEAIDRPMVDLLWDGSRWQEEPAGRFVVEQVHQIANYADWCNDCGNCDTFCPEYGGPFVEKPSFFGSLESYHRWSSRDGFYLESLEGGGHLLHGRLQGAELTLSQPQPGGPSTFGDGTLSLPLAADGSWDLGSARPGAAAGQRVSGQRALNMHTLLRGALNATRVTPVNVTWVSLLESRGELPPASAGHARVAAARHGASP